MGTDEEVATSKAGEPVIEAVPLPAKARSTERGSLRGSIHIAEDFDDLPEDLADAFGMR